MAADAALISSFSKLASAGQRDYSRQLQLQKQEGDILREGITKIGDTITKGIEEHRASNEKARLENQKRGQEFQKSITQTAEEIQAGGGLQEDVGNAIRAEIRNVETEYKSYNPIDGSKQSTEDKDAQLKSFNKLPEIEKEIVKARTIFGTKTKVSTEGMSPEAMNIYSMCLNSSQHDNVKSSMVDNKLQYEITTPAYIDPVSRQEITPASTDTYTLDDLEEMFVPEATETEDFILRSGNDFRERGGKERYGEVTENMLQGEADKIAGKLEESPKVLADIAQRRLEGRSTKKDVNKDRNTGKWAVGSVAYQLQDDPSLDMAVYQAAGVDVDKDKDGVVSPEEAKAVFMDGPNRDVVISTIVDPNYVNPFTGEKAYNHQLSCSIVGMHIAKQHTQYYNEGQAAKYKQEQGNKKEDVSTDTSAMSDEELINFYSEENK